MGVASEPEAEPQRVVPGSDTMLLEALVNGAVCGFAELPSADLPASSGIYTIWDGPILVYVGMAGRNGESGIRGRLRSHASGRRSGDQFCVYVCDRFVLPTLTPAQLQAVAGAELSLDALTREYIRTRLSFRWLSTSTGSEALRLERKVQAGALQAGRPVLNPNLTLPIP